METSNPAVEPAPSNLPAETAEPLPQKPEGSYVKFAMRNMVRKRGKSLFHFLITTISLLAILVGLSYLTR